MKFSITLLVFLALTCITSAQQVGINKTNPEYSLDVRANSNEEAAQLNVSNQDKSRYLRIYSGSSLYPEPSISIAPERSLLFASFDDAAAIFTEYMRISSIGNVGIGTTDPAHKLDVNGHVKVAGQISGVFDPISPQDAATKAYVDLLETTVATLEAQVATLEGVKDIDNNSYGYVTIGTQTWMAENLATTRYNDGTAIPLITDDTAWETASLNGEPGYTWYDNGASEYGGLYNYFVVADTSSRNVCPVGWHVPSNSDWTILTTYLGGTSAAGGKMKEGGLAHWNVPNKSATNESEFAGLSGGFRTYDGSFGGIGSNGYWWSSTEKDTSFSWARNLNWSLASVLVYNPSKGNGNSIRCLKD